MDHSTEQKTIRQISIEMIEISPSIRRSLTTTIKDIEPCKLDTTSRYYRDKETQ